MDFSQRAGDPPPLRSLSASESEDFHNSPSKRQGGHATKLYPSPHRSYNSYEDNEETSDLDEEDEDEIDILSEEQDHSHHKRLLTSHINTLSSRGINPLYENRDT